MRALGLTCLFLLGGLGSSAFAVGPTAAQRTANKPAPFGGFKLRGAAPSAGSFGGFNLRGTASAAKEENKPAPATKIEHAAVTVKNSAPQTTKSAGSQPQKKTAAVERVQQLSDAYKHTGSLPPDVHEAINKKLARSVVSSDGKKFIKSSNMLLATLLTTGKVEIGSKVKVPAAPPRWIHGSLFTGYWTPGDPKATRSEFKPERTLRSVKAALTWALSE